MRNRSSALANISRENWNLANYARMSTQQGRSYRISAAALALLSLQTASVAQESAIDTSQVYELGVIVKTAERSTTVLANTTSATSVLSGTTLRRLPGLTVTDHLSRTPGMFFFSLDGLGFEPQATVRGFYGGGEAEYVQLQLNGEPLSDAESGLVNWFAIPVTSVESVEILRGGSSALYGDAAVGAVINLITPPDSDEQDLLAIRSGSRVPFETSFRHTGQLSARQYSVFGGFTTVDGFRDHSKRDFGTVGARFQVGKSPRSEISLNTEHHWNYGDVPGPLLLGEIERTASLPFFRYDRVEESIHRLGGVGEFRFDDRKKLDLSLSSQLRKNDVTETIPLSAGFADTQYREIRDVGVRAAGQLTISSASGAIRLAGGTELSSQWLDSQYFSVLAGTESDYEAAPLSPVQNEVSSGEGTRQSLAIYTHYDMAVGSRARLTAGARLDVLRDRFDPRTAESMTVTHTALSPKIGVNYRLVSTASTVTNLYANVSQSFKAPTFDQLYEQRTIPVPFPPFAIQLSSSQLDPQYGTSVEAGLYHRFQYGDVSGEASVALYQIDMRDEIDFDLQLLTYRNLGKSRHRGIETEAALYLGSTTVRGSYAYQATTLRFEPFDGNFVKAIPRDVVSAGVDLPFGSFGASATLKAARRIFLDDANTLRLPSYTSVDARLSYDLGRATVAAEVFNLFDSKFSTTGFPDPAGSEAIFVYPYSGRHFRLGAFVRFP